MTDQTMSKLERLLAARDGLAVDRVPVALWRHWPEDERSADVLAEKTLDFQERFDFDMVKVTPSGLKGVADWGVRVGPPYNGMGEPKILRWGVSHLDDWEKIETRDPHAGRVGQEVAAVRAVGSKLSGKVPFVQTLFFPLTNAGKLAGGRLLTDLREHPDVIHKVLRVITDSTVSFARECLTVGGADGVFVSSKYAGNSLCTREEYIEFGVPYDLAVLEGIADICKFTILHLHGDDVIFDLFASYPVDFVNWHDRGSNLSIAEASKLYKCGLMGGIANTVDFVQKATLDDLRGQVRDAIAQTDGRRLVIAPGCVMPVGTTDAQYLAVRRAVEEWS